MAFGKKLKDTFNRFARSAAYTVAAVATSVTIGLGVGIYPDHVSDNPPFHNTVAHETAVKDAEKLGNDIVRGYRQLVFDSEALKSAQRNIGTSNGRLKEQWNDLQEIREKYKEAYNAQYRRMDNFERDIMFSPNISEAEAQKMLGKLRDASEWQSEPYRRFEELRSTVAYRDEAREWLKLPASPEKTTFEQFLKMREAVHTARGIETVSDAMDGFDAAALTGLGFLGAGIFARRSRRREEEQQAQSAQQPPVVASAPPPPPPAPEPEKAPEIKKPRFQL